MHTPTRSYRPRCVHCHYAHFVNAGNEGHCGPVVTRGRNARIASSCKAYKAPHNAHHTTLSLQRKLPHTTQCASYGIPRRCVVCEHGMGWLQPHFSELTRFIPKIGDLAITPDWQLYLGAAYALRCVCRCCGLPK